MEQEKPNRGSNPYLELKELLVLEAPSLLETSQLLDFTINISFSPRL